MADNRFLFGVAILIWSFVVAASLAWNLYHSNITAIEFATNEAIVHFKNETYLRDFTSAC